MEGPEVLEQEMSTILGYNTKPTYGWAYTYQGYANQFCGMPVTAPADGTIATLGAWIGTAVAMGGGPPRSRFGLCSGTTRTVRFSVTPQVFQSGLSPRWPPTAEHFEAAITPVAVTSGHNYRIGVAHGDPNSQTRSGTTLRRPDHYYFDGTTYKSYPATFSLRTSKPPTDRHICLLQPVGPGHSRCDSQWQHSDDLLGVPTRADRHRFPNPVPPRRLGPFISVGPYFVWVPIANTSVSFLQPPWLTGTVVNDGDRRGLRAAPDHLGVEFSHQLHVLVAVPRSDARADPGYGRVHEWPDRTAASILIVAVLTLVAATAAVVVGVVALVTAR